MSNEQFRSFIDRILRLKSEQDTIAADIREVYAEAKGTGFDKTAMGQLVTYLRKREKNPEQVAEQSAIFDLYLSSYEAPHARAREEQPSGTPTEVHEPTPSGPHGADESGSQFTGESHESTEPAERVGPTEAPPSTGEPRAETVADDIGIPTFLRRGHEDCSLGSAQ